MTKDNGNNGNAELSPIPNSPPPSPPTSRRPSNLGVDETLPSSNPPSHPPSRRNSDVAPDEEPPLPPEGQDDLTPEGQDGLPPIPVYPDFTDEPTQPFTESSSFSFKPSTSTDQLGLTSELLAEHNLVAETFFASPVASPSQSISDQKSWEAIYRGSIFINKHQMINPVEFNALAAFCRGEYSPENVNFLIQYENYERLRSLTKTNVDALRDKFIQMHNTFINSEGASQINIYSITKTALDIIYQELNNGTLSPRYLLNNDVFLDVATEIRNVLEKDTYGRFKPTKEYKEASKASMRDIAVTIFGNRKFVAHCLDDKGRQKLHMVENQQTLTAKGEAEEAKIIGKALQGRAMEVTNSLPIGLYREFARDWDEALQRTITHLPSAREDDENALDRLVPNFLAFNTESGKFYQIQRTKDGNTIKVVPPARNFERKSTVVSMVKSGEKKYNSISDLRNGGYEIYELCEDQFLYSLLSKFVSRPLEFQHSKFSEITGEFPLGSYITSKDQKGKSTIAIVVGPDPEKPNSGNRIVSIKDSRGVTVLTDREKAELSRDDSDVYIPQVTPSNQSFIDNYTSTIAGLIGKGVTYDSGKEGSSKKHRGSVFSKEKPDHWTKSLAKFYSYKEANDNGFVTANHLKTHAAALFTFAMQKAAFDSIGGGFSGFHRIEKNVEGGEFTARLQAFTGSGVAGDKKAVVNIFEAWYNDNHLDIEVDAEKIHHGFKKPASHTNIATFVQNILGVVDISLTEETLKKQGGKDRGAERTTTSTNSSERSDTGGEVGGGAEEERGSTITEERRPRFGMFFGGRGSIRGGVPETPRRVPAASTSSRGPAVQLQEEGKGPETPRGGRW